MLTFESYSPIRVRDKKESAIWITLLVVMSVLLCLAIILATWFSAGGLFGPVEGGAWWAYGETMSAPLGMILGQGVVRFVSATQWEIEVVGDCWFALFSSGGAATKEGRMWCTGPYEFVGEPGEGALRMMLDPDMVYLANGALLDPTNARLCKSDGSVAAHREWVEYLPDENGVYHIKMAMVNKQADGKVTASDVTIDFPFLVPEDTDLEPGYYYEDDIKEYLASIGVEYAG